MTREEAIDMLVRDKEQRGACFISEAIDMAIKALEQEPCDDWYDVPSDEMTFEQARQAVKDLRRKLAEYLEQEPCEDAVSRAEAIRLAEQGQVQGFEWQIRKLVTLPSVAPTRKKGKWERGYSFPDGEYVKCTVCGEIIKCIYPMHYCPNCGADMRGEE